MVEHLRDLLLATLPQGIPVLLPEEAQEPYTATAAKDAQGRPKVGGGERGLGAYLTAHPQGYVQVEAPQGLSAGLGHQYLIQVACVAATRAAADALAHTAARAVSSRAGGQQTRYTLTTPPSSRALSVHAAWAGTFILTARKG